MPRVVDITKSYGGNTILDRVSFIVNPGERVGLVGPNGCGKTTLLRIIVGQETLLKIIAGELAPTAGQALLGANVRLGYYSQEQENLPPESTPLAEIRGVAPFTDTEARSFLHYFLFAGEDMFVPVSSLSYGERARLALAKLVASSCNLLLLDEPINHLDISSRENFAGIWGRFSWSSTIAILSDALPPPSGP